MTRATLLALSLLAACAPSQRRLLANRHYDEALHGVTKGGVDGVEVVTAIEADLQVGLHMQAVGAEAMRTRLAAAGNNIPPGLDAVVMVRVIHDSNQIERVFWWPTFALLHRGTLLPPVEPGPATLAALLGEAPAATPTYRDVYQLTLLGRIPVGASTAVASPGEAITSPASGTLRQWLEPGRCIMSAGEPCTEYLLWPRPRHGGEAPLELVVAVNLYGLVVALLYRFALPAGSFEAGLAALFGDRMRTLSQLHRLHGRGRSVVYPLDVLRGDPDGGFTLASRRKLTRLVIGTRRRPGLRTYPGLRLRIDPTGLPGGAQSIPELRAMLLGLGLSDRQIEIRPASGSGKPTHGLLVHHDLPPLAARAPDPQASRAKH